jgi:orotate phosphoribosyltransferase
MSFSPAWKQRLLELIDQRCLITGSSLTLSTGAASSFYFDCKRATLHGECLDLISDAFLAEMAEFPVRPDAIGGLTLGADFITAAVVMTAHRRGMPLEGSIVRKEPKKHGTKTPIENELPVGTRVVVVDDVITTGSSTLQAAEKFQASGYEIVGVIALVDREAGGAETLAAKLGCQVRSVFRKRDFARLSEGECHGAVGELVAA